MDFLLLWLECSALLLLWMALAVALDAHLPKSLWRWATLLGLTGVSLVALLELTGVLSAAVLLRVPFAVAFVSSVAAVFFAGSGLLLWRGLRAEQPGLAPRAASWPWQRLALALVIACGLAATTLNDMRIAARQQLVSRLTELRELLGQLDPPVPPELNAAPLYEEASAHLLPAEAVAGAHEAFAMLESSPSPEASLAPPLLAWVEKNQPALEQARRGLQRPLFARLEASWFRGAPSRLVKVARLDTEDRSLAPAAAHRGALNRIAHVLEVEALQRAARGERAAAVDDANALTSLQRQAAGSWTQSSALLEKLLATPGWTDAELARIELRDDSSLKARLQITLAEGELRELESLSFFDTMPLTVPEGSLRARAGAVTMEIARGFLDVLTIGALADQTVARYDQEWEAIYAPPAQRLGRLEQVAKQAHSNFATPVQLREELLTRMASEARRACAQTGIAIARYLARHGRAPASLDELVPGQLLEIPLDPFDGQPLRYRADAEGALVYSLGADAHDDGGKPSSAADPLAARGSDLVFRVPPRR